ncbi:MAG: putative DNA binding domain-containing protein [Hominisplanchenecus sp.]|nr:putative DNA binding domain-containing protein [Lachnospiraceae bacterium]MDY2820326.1 putative DNA binding domain-containing protein [Hominisplanchenecus sp.]
MKAQKWIAAGQNETTVFKNCRDGIHTDVFETICAFLNSRGGHILLGVNENGSVPGLRERAIPDIIKGLTQAAQNEEIFRPVFYLDLEEEIVEGKHILVLSVPESPEVHALRGQIFVRRDGETVRLERREELARLYARKQDIYTERKIYPYLREHDLREELIARARARILMTDPEHPWGHLENAPLLAEMNLSGINYETGERGLRFLAALLMGKDSTLRNIFGNTQVYCEKQEDGRMVRATFETNLLDETEKITAFLENALGKERAAAFAAVFLSEREYTAAYPATIRVNRQDVTAEFAGSMGRFGNPLLTQLLRVMGLYPEKLPEGLTMQKKDGICLLCMSWKEIRSESRTTADQDTDVVQETLPFVKDAYAQYDGHFTPEERQTEILKMMAENDRVSIGTMVRSLQVTKRTILRDIDKLKKQNLVVREGSEKNGRWLLTSSFNAEEKTETEKP